MFPYAYFGLQKEEPLSMNKQHGSNAASRFRRMNEKKYIPIGNDCSVSHYLRRQGLRHEAYPFDWNVTPIQSALSLIENNFDGFLDFKNLQFLSPTNRLLFKENGVDLEISNDIITPVVCHRYGILFPHDFSQNGPGDYEEVKKKYAKRISRLMHLLQTPSPKEFIFTLETPNDWQLEQYRAAGLAFDVVNEQETMKQFQRLQHSKIEIRSLNSLKEFNATWGQRTRRIISRIKKKFG